MNYLNNAVMDYNENIQMVINDKNDLNGNGNIKVVKKNRKFMNDTFYITYVLLLTTATVCFIEAIRTKDIKIRNILNLEVCISFVAAYFYSVFMEKININDSGGDSDNNIDFSKINITRYTDWSITTPIMLLVLLLALLYNTGGSLEISKFLVVLLLNFGMLASGYMGIRGNITKNAGLISGFVLFFALYGYIYMNFMHGKYHFDNVLIFGAFFVFWSLYGVIYMLGDEYEEEKNIGYNLLDLFSKCFVGIFFWAYFTGVFILK